MKTMIQFLLVMFTIITISAQSTAQWVQTSGPCGDDIQCFALSPNGASGTNLFAGTSGDGVFFSTNYGTSWSAVNNGLPKASYDPTRYTFVFSLAVSPASGGAGSTNLFAGTLDGVFLSTNNGTTWTPASTGLTTHSSDGFHICDFAVAPNEAGGTNLFAGTYDGVFLSTNNGTSWTKVNTPSVHRTFPVCCLTVSDKNLFAGTTDQGVFLSSNNGTNWTAVNTGLTDTYVNSLISFPNGIGGANLFVAIAHGVFFSTNDGASWTKASTGLPPQDPRVWAFAFSPFSGGSSSNNLFAGTWDGVYLSTNNGTNWTQVNTGLASTYVRDIAVSPNGSAGSNIFAGTQGGVFLSTNSGISWTSASTGLTKISVYGFAVSPNGTGGAGLFAGTSCGIFLSTDNGTTWTSSSNGVTNSSVYSFAVSSNSTGGTNIFAGTTYSGICLSTNNGASWIPVNTGIEQGWATNFAVIGKNLFAGMDFAYGENLFADRQGMWEGDIYLSTNNGTSWSAVGIGSPGVTALAVSTDSYGTGDTNLFAGTYGNGIFLSTNNGTSWSAVNNGLPKNVYGDYTWVGSLCISGTNLFAGTDAGVFLSTNNGTSWNAVNTGMTKRVVISFAISPASVEAGGTNLFVGTDSGGVFLSTNNGTTWVAVNKGLPNIAIRTLAISPASGGTSSPNLFAGTSEYPHGDGVWRRPLSEMITTSMEPPSAQIPERFELGQNYPNPFNPTSVISYQLPVASSMRLAVFDLLGREVAVLVNEQKDAGRYEVTWDASRFSSGIYFYRLRAGQFQETKRMILIK